MDNSDNHSYLQVLQKCGCFQWTVSSLVMLQRLLCAVTMYFMAFGAYNPGWKCLDDDYNYNINNSSGNGLTIKEQTSHNNTSTGLGFTDSHQTSNSNITSPNMTMTSTISWETSLESCQVFESCKHVVFNPEASTIVSEWSLVCGRAWISAFIMSAMMAGLPIGTLILGYFGDRFGRKWTVCSGILSLGVLHLVGMYSVNWQMFAAVRFFMGAANAIVGYGSTVLAMEFNPETWRPIVQSFPSWNMGMLVLCLLAMTTQDWRTIHLITSIMSLVSLLPFLWVPESLRWLHTNGKQGRSVKVVKKIAKINKIDLPYENMIEMLNKGNELNAMGEMKEKLKEESINSNNNRYHVIDLFRKRLKFTAVIGICFFCVDMVYFSTNLGVSVFPGNVYINMIIMSASEIPSSFIAAFIPNVAGRRITVAASFLICCFCFSGVGIADLLASSDVKVYTVLGLVIVGKIGLNIAWFSQSVQTIELYPTVLRSTAVGFSGFSAGIGSIVAPYLIPATEDSLYVNYFIVGAFLVLCCVLELLLPETKGKALPDTWEDESIEFGS